MRSETKRQTSPAHASATKAAPQAPDSRNVASAPQTRGPRLPKGIPAKDDRAKALAFLATTDMRGCRWSWWKNKASLKAEEWADLANAMKLLVERGVSLDDEDIEIIADAYRDTEEFMNRMRGGEAVEVRAARAALQKLEEVDVSDDDPNSTRKLLPGTSHGRALFLAAKKVIDAANKRPKVKRGHPVNEPIDTVLQYGRSIGWDWEVCAAAVFLSGAWTVGYKFAKKSFGDWNRRNTLPPPTSDLWADEFMKKHHD